MSKKNLELEEKVAYVYVLVRRPAKVAPFRRRPCAVCWPDDAFVRPMQPAFENELPLV
jgi:hypothetical protein